MDSVENDDYTYYGEPKRPVVKAVCPINKEHRAVVRNTRGKVRRCYCHDCDRTFKMVGPAAG